MNRKEKIRIRKRIQGICKVAGKVRSAAQSYETFSFLDIEDLMPDVPDDQIRNAIQEFRSSGEIQSIRRGVYKYGAGKKKRRTYADIIWHLVRSHRQFNTDEIQRLSGAARCTVREYLQCLRRLGHINKTGQSQWMLISDPGPETPVDERKRNEHRTPACHASQTIPGHSAETKGIAGRSNVQHRILNKKNKFGLKNREP